MKLILNPVKLWRLNKVLAKTHKNLRGKYSEYDIFCQEYKIYQWSVSLSLLLGYLIILIVFLLIVD